MLIVVYLHKWDECDGSAVQSRQKENLQNEGQVDGCFDLKDVGDAQSNSEAAGYEK